MVALTVGNPGYETLKSRLQVSAEYQRENTEIKQESAPPFRMNSNRLLVKFSSSFVDGWSLGLLLGGSDMNVDYSSRSLSDYNGSWELAFGAESKNHYWDFCLGNRGEYGVLRSYFAVGYLTTLTRGKATRGADTYYKISYRWNEFGGGVYWLYENPWYTNLVFYFGGEWHNVEGKIHYERYFKSSQMSKSDGYFYVPTLYPKPMVGLDIILPNRYTLSFELRFWDKHSTSLTIGVSQIGEAQKRSCGECQSYYE